LRSVAEDNFDRYKCAEGVLIQLAVMSNLSGGGKIVGRIPLKPRSIGWRIFLDKLITVSKLPNFLTFPTELLFTSSPRISTLSGTPSAQPKG
jgi:hypothetical protein